MGYGAGFFFFFPRRSEAGPAAFELIVRRSGAAIHRIVGRRLRLRAGGSGSAGAASVAAGASPGPPTKPPRHRLRAGTKRGQPGDKGRGAGGPAGGRGGTAVANADTAPRNME